MANTTGMNIPGMQDSTDFMKSLSAASNNPLTKYASPTVNSNPLVNNNVPFGNAFGGGPVQIPGADTGGKPAYENGLDVNILGQLTSAYGEGAGDTLWNFLLNGAGYNPQIAQQLLSQFAPQISQGSANLASEFGAAGMGNSSSAGIAQGVFQSEMANNENNLLASLYEQGSNNYMNTLLGLSGVGGGGTNIGNNQGSALGTANSILGMISGGAGALSAAGVGGSTGTIATILSILAGI